MDSGAVTFGLIYRIWHQSAECPAFIQKPWGGSYKPVVSKTIVSFSELWYWTQFSDR